jgi:hypothetical protein
MPQEFLAPDQEYKNYLNSQHFHIFLGGSIEQDTAKPWQKRIRTAFKDPQYDNVVLLNPRRPHWDPSWKNVKSNAKFREQVLWELQALRDSDYIIMYFDPATKSPISLLETGIHIQSFNPRHLGKKLMVVCPRGFWRKGNVDITCEFYGGKVYSSMKQVIETLKTLHNIQWSKSKKRK